MRRLRRIVAIFPLLAILLTVGGATVAQEVRTTRFFTISGGSVAGIYTQAASVLCRLFNRENRMPVGDPPYICEDRPAFGSVFNVNALKRDLVAFGLVQSDRQWQAWTGRGSWSEGPVTSIRSVVALHKEAIHLIARKDSGISSVRDLKDRRVNIGNISSGQRGNAISVLTYAGIDPMTDLRGYGFQQANAFDHYSEGRLDAMFYTVGVPSLSIGQVFERVPSTLIDLDSETVRSFARRLPYHAMMRIPAGTYPGLERDVMTVGLKATLMTTAAMPEDLVYRMVRTLFENLEEYRLSHPAYRDLTPETMLDGLAADLHPGAERYYRERGWIE